MASTSDHKKSLAGSEPIDAIPMKKSNPTMVLAIVGGLVVVIGVVAFSMTRGKSEKAAQQQQAAAQAPVADTAAMTPEEQKRHLEITQKSIAVWKEQKAEQDAKKKADDEAAKAKEAEAAPVAKAGGGAPASQGGGAPPPAPKKPSKKDVDALDGLGAGIASELGK
jgi:hypothetical protein